MDLERFLSWLNENKEWLFSGTGVVLVTAFVGVVWKWRQGQPADSSGTTIDLNGMAGRLVETSTQLGAAQEREQSYQTELRQKEEEIEALRNAVEAPEEQRNVPDAPPGVDDAVEQLSEGKTDAAEALFSEVLERKKAEGKASLKEAAAAARHLGALAFLHDTQKALSAYTQAVELDPDDPSGRNMLGRLRRRIGDLDGAVEAYERVLELGNRVGDNSAMSVAYGNLGIVYKTRGDLAKAEEFYLEALAIDEELGRKEGMASQYGNLGNVYQMRGDLAKAEEYHLKSLAIEEELGRKEGMASEYGNLGIVYQMRGDLAKAEEFYLKALAINEELGRKEGMANDYGNLGNLYQMRGDLAKAEEFYLKSLAIEEELGRKEGMANAYANLGTVYRMRGDLAKACEAWRTSKRLFEDVGALPQVKKTQALIDEAGCGQEEVDTKDDES